LDVPAGQYRIMFTSSVTGTTNDRLIPTDWIGCAIGGVGALRVVRLGADSKQVVMIVQGVVSSPLALRSLCSAPDPRSGSRASPTTMS
jgi:hypothetical protein